MSRMEDQDTIEEMANVIVALTRDTGRCTRMDLLKAGFAAMQIEDYYAMASAMAALLLQPPPKNH